VMRDLGEPDALKAAQDFLNQDLAPSKGNLPVLASIETLIGVCRLVLPWLSLLALAGWLWATPLPPRRLDEHHRLLWLIGGLLLTLVVARLALVALINVTSWPAINLRYLSAAQPLLLFLDAIGLLLLVPCRAGGLRANRHDTRA
jgi:hypothetical protein